MVHEGRTVGVWRYEAACRLIARLDSYRLLTDLDMLTRGDVESTMQAQDEYALLSGVDVRPYQGSFGRATLDRLRRDLRF